MDINWKSWVWLYTIKTAALVSAGLILATIAYYGAETVVDRLADRLVQKLDKHNNK
jgi:hypothetical protein